MRILKYDGSFAGFLCTIQHSLDMNLAECTFSISSEDDTNLFDEKIVIDTDINTSKKIWNLIKSKVDNLILRQFYVVFLSEDKLAIMACFKTILKVLQCGKNILNNFSDEDIIVFHQMIRKVEREKHRMMAFVRFKKSTDGVYFSTIEPDYNVLPLIAKFFKYRYADQPWLIYDIKRKYGLSYDLTQVVEIQLLATSAENSILPAIQLVNDEDLYNKLWRDYYNSTNIESRRNLKLHIKNVPKRYWKYLIEKG